MIVACSSSEPAFAENVPSPSLMQAQAVQQQSSSDRIEELTRQILKEELELQKVNTQFRLETALTSRWRQRRVFLYGETNATCSEISLIEQVSSRLQLLRSRRAARGHPNEPVETDDEPDSNNTSQVSSSTTGSTTTSSNNASSSSNSTAPPKTGGRVHGRLQAATETQMIGQSVSACGDVFELGLNFLHYQQIKKRGFSPALYRQRVHAIALRLDSLLNERDRALANEIDATPATVQLQGQESKMLKDLRDLSMIDYREYHAATKRFWALQNTAFMLDFSRNCVGITGNLISLTGSHYRHPRYAGTGGLCTAITGSLVMLQPIVGRVSGNISGTAARKLVSKELTNINTKSSAVFAADRKKLAAICQQGGASETACAGIIGRLPLYSEQQRLMDDMNSYFASERRRAHNTLIENIAFASAVGPPRAASGVTGIVGGWRYYQDTDAKERLYLAGNIAYLAGTSVNVVETARVQASEELRQYKLGKKHMRTGTRLKARVAALEKLQTSLK